MTSHFSWSIQWYLSWIWIHSSSHTWVSYTMMGHTVTACTASGNGGGIFRTLSSFAL